MALRKTAPTFTCRCSALGQLMTLPRSKSDSLSETAKTMLTVWYKEQLYNRRKDITSKYLTKGNTCEDSSITYLNQLYGTSWSKNEQHYRNEFIHGTPDIVDDTTIIDIKNSWDFTTFPLFSSSIPNKDYQWQVQGYMWLTGKTTASVVYTLMDLPDDQIAREWRSAGNSGEPTDEFKANHQYHGVDNELRVKRYDFTYSPDLTEQIQHKVLEARKFVESLHY